MKKKYYKWIPLLGFLLVLFNIDSEELDLSLDTPLEYYGSMIWQIIASYLIITLIT